MLFGACSVALIGSCQADTEAREACIAEHKGQSYVVENEFATTSDGCKIREILKYDARCRFDARIYVTSCSATTTWQRPSGKTSVTESNHTQGESK